MTNKPAGVIFDLDGVLWDSNPAHARAYEQALEPYGLRFSYERIAGRRTPEVFEEVLAPLGKSELVEELTRRKRELALVYLSQDVAVETQCREVLASLKELGLELALASSASRPTVELFLDKSGTRGFFCYTASGDDVDRGKPDPAIYLQTAQKMNLEPASCIVVEDAEMGVRAARAAGMSVILKLGTLPTARGLDVTATIKGLAEIPGIVCPS